MRKIDKIARDTEVLRQRLVEKVPGHFGMRHVVTAFFGALFFGFTFVLKGLLLDISTVLTNTRLVLITLATLIIVSAEIYYVGYRKVPDKNKRPFGQFWAKRIITYYLIAIFVSYLILSLYGVSILAGTENTIKLVVALSFPAAIGAAVSDLLGKY